jgi:DNA modification methylase
LSLSIEYLPIDVVRPYPRNARTHSRAQIAQIAESIRAFGFTNPVLVDDHNEIIAGHGRLEAARSLGMEGVPAIRLPHLSAAQKRALRLADNKIAENAGWDLDLLAIELGDLSEMELDVDLTVTGFEVGEIDLVLGAASEADDPEQAPLPDRVAPPVTRRGDLWRLGPHHVLCGDARDPADYARLLDGRRADMGFTDPPYNVLIAGHVSGKGRVVHREFAEACGEMSPETFRNFLAEALGLGARHSRDGAVWYCFIDWRHAEEMIAAGRRVFGSWLNLCVWAKTNGGMGSLYRSQHELVFVFRAGRAQHRNNVQLGKFGRNRTNLWTYPGVNVFRPGRMEELSAHPTAKPVALVQDAILDVTARGARVLDPFLGAGATLLAAERAGRVACGLEIDPAYVDVAVRRWRAETGGKAVREADGVAFDAVEASRVGETG